MNASPVAPLVRGWVDLYTRGMPASVRAARRDEVEDDLWCQHDEAAALGRSPRSLGAEMLLRLLLGMPADISWRMTHRSDAAASGLERSSSMSTRVIGALAILAGASWATVAILVLGSGPAVLLGPNEPILSVIGLVGAAAFAGATVGIAWRYQDQLTALSALSGVLAGLGALFTALGGYAANLLLPIGSTVLAWGLARTGIVSRVLAIIHAASALAILASLIGSIVDYRSTVSSGLLVAIAIPYMLTWVAIGVSLLRGAPRASESAAG
jgi:hypothetical protein